MRLIINLYSLGQGVYLLLLLILFRKVHWIRLLERSIQLINISGQIFCRLIIFKFSERLIFKIEKHDFEAFELLNSKI